MRIEPEAFRAAWPQVVRSLAVSTRSLDLGEEYAAEAFARAAAQPGRIDDLAAWCVQVGRRVWLDDLRHQAVARRSRAELARPEAAEMTPQRPAGDELDDRLALLFVACDEALATGAQLVLAMRVVCGLDIRQIATHLGIAEATAAARLTRAKAALARARDEFVVPSADERRARLGTMLACISALLNVGQREAVAPVDATVDPARDALTLAEAVVAEYPDDREALGLRACCRLALARRPGRVRDGVALPLDEVDRSAWDAGLLAAGLDDAARAVSTATEPGRFALEAAISGVHSTAAAPEQTDWDQLAVLYEALLTRWPSPAVRVARLVVLGRRSAQRGEDLRPFERELEEIAAEGPAYAARDAALALADLEWRTGRRPEGSARYRELLEVVPEGPLREFCRRRGAGA